MKKFFFIFLTLAYLLGISCPLAAAPVSREKIEKLVEQLSNGSYQARGELLKIGAPAVPYLIEELKLCPASGLVYNNWDNDYPAAAVLRDLGAISIPALVKVIRLKPDPEQICGAEIVLSQITDLKAVPQLLKLSDDSNPAVQNAAIKALGNIKDPKTIAILCDKLKHTTPKQAQNLLLALAKITPEKSPAILAILKDSDPQNRIYGYIILFNSKTIPGFAIFLTGITDSDPQVKRTILDLLYNNNLNYESWVDKDQICKAIRPLLNDPDWNFRRKAVKLLARFGDLPGVIMGFKDSDNQVRRVTASVLDGIHDKPEIVDVIFQAFKNQPPPLTYEGKPLPGQLKENAEPNYWALSNDLSKIGESAVPALQKALQDPDWHIRLYSLRALSEINKEENFPLFVSALKDPDPEVRKVAISTINGVKNPQTFPLLLAVTNKDCNTEVRLCAMETFYSRKEPQIFDALVKLAEDRDPKVSDKAINILAQKKDPRAIPVLIAHLADSDTSGQFFALDYLITQKDPRVVTGLIPVLLYKDWQTRGWVVYYLSKNWPQAPQTALTYLQTTDPKKFRAGIELAQALKLKSAVPYLKKNLNHPDDNTRWNSISALVAIEGRESQPDLLDKLNDPSPKIRGFVIYSLAELKIKEVADKIRPLLKDPDLGIRCIAIEYLISVKDPEGMKEIKKMAEDKNQPQDIKKTINDALKAGGVPEPSIEIYPAEEETEKDW